MSIKIGKRDDEIRHSVTKSLSAVSRALGVSHRTLVERHGSGDVPRRSDGKFDTREVLDWIRRRNDAEALQKRIVKELKAVQRKARGVEDGDLSSRTAVLAALNEEKLKQEKIVTMKMRGEVVLVESVVEAFRQLAGTIRQRFSNFPGRMALTLEGKSKEQIQQAVEIELKEAFGDVDAAVNKIMVSHPRI